MRILIAEDDLASRTFLFKLLSRYGDCDITVDGIEAVEAFMLSHQEKQPYDIVCLDIMMPKLDGIKTLRAMRELEEDKSIETSKKSKIVMTTALNDASNVKKAFEIGCEAYVDKPIDTFKMIEVMEKLGLI